MFLFKKEHKLLTCMEYKSNSSLTLPKYIDKFCFVTPVQLQGSVASHSWVAAAGDALYF